MIAQLPLDRMPPPRPEGIPRFQRLFREAAGLNFYKADLKHYEEFIDHRIYLLLLRAEANAKAGGDVLIEPWNLPITPACRNASSTRKWTRRSSWSRSSIVWPSDRRCNSAIATRPKRYCRTWPGDLARRSHGH